MTPTHGHKLKTWLHKFEDTCTITLCLRNVKVRGVEIGLSLSSDQSRS